VVTDVTTEVTVSTSGSPMTLKPAFAAASASGDVQKLEDVETSPRAFGAPANAASTPTLKHPKHGNDRLFYFPVLGTALARGLDA
jgi:hypothetical protein